MPKPYYQDDYCTIYLGDCLEVMPQLEPVDLVLTDPPYGINTPTDYYSRGCGKATESHDYPPIYMDDKPFNPSPLLNNHISVIWGANYFAEKLPPSPSWLIWDKREFVGSDNFADCEIAWSNIGGPARIFRHLWKGMLKASERLDRRCHPTQKPVALMRWCIQQSKAAGFILDPFMGSGTTLVAAKQLNRKAIGIEIEEKYCEIAVRRLAQEPFNWEKREG